MTGIEFFLSFTIGYWAAHLLLAAAIALATAGITATIGIAWWLLRDGPLTPEERAAIEWAEQLGGPPPEIAHDRVLAPAGTGLSNTWAATKRTPRHAAASPGNGARRAGAPAPGRAEGGKSRLPHPAASILGPRAALHGEPSNPAGATPAGTRGGATGSTAAGMGTGLESPAATGPGAGDSFPGYNSHLPSGFHDPSAKVDSPAPQTPVAGLPGDANQAATPPATTGTGPESEPSGVTAPAPDRAPGVADPPGDVNQAASHATPGPALPAPVADTLDGLAAAVAAIHAPTDGERWPWLEPGQGYEHPTGQFAAICEVTR